MRDRPFARETRVGAIRLTQPTTTVYIRVLQNQSRSTGGPLHSLGNALHCNGASYDLVNHGMGSSRIFDVLDRQFTVEFVVLFKQ